MTEVPEHLLQRSRERRAALGGAEAPPAAPSGGGGDAGAGGEPSGAVAVPAAAAAPAVVEAAPPRPLPPYVQAALARKKMPRWMAPVGAAALLWAFIYAGVLFQPPTTISDPVVLQGQKIFATQCSGCHGAGGEGGVGRPLAGQALLTFPHIQDHLNWVTHGSPAKGTPYGDPNRPGGQHISQTGGFGAMPAFGGTLSADEILAVVRYEREVLNNADPASDQVAAGSTSSSSSSSSGSASSSSSSSSSGGSSTTVAGSGGSNNPNANASASGGGQGGTSTTTTTTKP